VPSSFLHSKRIVRTWRIARYRRLSLPHVAPSGGVPWQGNDVVRRRL